MNFPMIEKTKRGHKISCHCNSFPMAAAVYIEELSIASVAVLLFIVAGLIYYMCMSWNRGQSDAQQEQIRKNLLQYLNGAASFGDALSMSCNDYKLIVNKSSTRLLSLENSENDIEAFIKLNCDHCWTNKVLAKWNKHRGPFCFVNATYEDECYYFFVFECEKKEELYRLMSALFSIRGDQIASYQQEKLFY